MVPEFFQNLWKLFRVCLEKKHKKEKIHTAGKSVKRVC
jgi:hypothetical protein